MKKRTKKTAVKKATKKKKAAGRKKTARKKAAKKTVRKKRGAPKRKPRKTAKKRGRPPGSKTRARRMPRAGKSIQLPVNNQTNISFWSNMITFLNQNKKKSFVIQLDGKNFSLSTE